MRKMAMIGRTTPPFLPEREGPFMVEDGSWIAIILALFSSCLHRINDANRQGFLHSTRKEPERKESILVVSSYHGERKGVLSTAIYLSVCLVDVLFICLSSEGRKC
ncbi:hypothetical protein CSUI_001848 [Cystoisospora suis]|uniref:Uncharacterized protein n=1 Tax=Cystoisospora suis TaxID=483139 RepID=A0A2C6LBI9_9APIC|nr:hypothetical protein CSUI_001848 [Cystoisospora suis]